MGADWLVRVDFESVEDFFIPLLLWSRGGCLWLLDY